jgi:uncharacterized protein with von Willebrand factor type A (vWA) domain
MILHRPRSPVEQVAGTVARLADRPGALSANLINFGRVLRDAGLDVTAGRLIDAGRSLALVGATAREDARAALRANLVSDHDQLPLFDALFDAYWRGADEPVDPLLLAQADDHRSATPPTTSATSSRLAALLPRTAHAPHGENPEATAGATDLITVKDFAGYTDADLPRARRAVRRIAPRLASALARRRRQSRRGDDIDLRRSLSRAARHGGEVLHLIRRRRRVRRLRLVLLCDVSGSMDRYSRELVQFLFAVQSELRGVSTFVFSTRLHDVTHLLKTRSFDEALSRLSRDVDAWSGGTSIGRCLLQFERHYARMRVDSRTVVVIISDGWERGDTDQLRAAMAGLKRRARRVLWLNPLLGHPEYRPLARGMATALPYVDAFLPAHSIDALARAVRTAGAIARSFR